MFGTVVVLSEADYAARVAADDAADAADDTASAARSDEPVEAGT